MKCQKCVKLKHQNHGISCNVVLFCSHSAILNNENNVATCIMSLPFFPVANAPIRRTCLWFVMGEHQAPTVPAPFRAPGASGRPPVGGVW